MIRTAYARIAGLALTRNFAALELSNIAAT